MYSTMSPILRLLIILFIWKAARCERLISLNKSIRSSSTHTALYQNWDPRNAVDGNRTNTPNTCKCCAATRLERSPWFELDLGREFLIERIDVVGRSSTEERGQNLGHMEIFLAPEKDIQRKTALTKVTRTRHSFNFSLPNATPSRFVTLIRQNTWNFFIICELSVYGECKNGIYGFECKQTCGKCFNNAPCDNVNGTCDRCADGYMGTKCDSTCNYGKYGADCQETCGHCKNKETCNHVDGKCPDKCEAGYTGDMCKTDCNAGTYGEGCQSKCGHCINGSACDVFSGNCSECDEGYYGVRCLLVQSAKSEGNVIVPTIASILSVVFLVAIVIIALIIWIKVKRRRAQNPGGEEPRVGTISTLNRAEERQSIRVPSLKYENTVTLNMNQKAVKMVMETRTTEGDDQDEHIYTECLEEEMAGAYAPLTGVGVDHQYYELLAKDTDIKIHQLWDYIVDRKKQKNNSFYQEFSQLPQDLHHPHQAALLEENRPKNRYNGLYAYDHSRVPLKAEKGESEYINACFVNGFAKPKRFIASQGPTIATRDDFWRMIWQEKSKQIIMLTNLVEMGNEECLIYWPMEGQVTYGKIKIYLQSEESFGDFTIRKLKVQGRREAPVIVTQYHFTAWPDKEVPDTTWSLVKFWRTVAEDRDSMEHNEPIIVHCSAGIGRTGIFIALDNAYTQAKVEGTIRIQNIVKLLREQRVNMVETLQQYIYLHEVLADAFLFGTSPICMSQFHEVHDFLKESEKETKNPRLQTQYDLLVESIEDSYHEKELAEGKLETANIRSETKIGAVFLPDWQEKGSFIAMKTPKNSELTDFWSMIQEQNVQTIVSLGVKKKADKERTCFHLHTKLQNKFKLTLVEENVTSRYIERKLTYKSQTKEDFTVKQYECTEWKSSISEPIEPQAFIDLLENVLHWQQNLSDTHPVLIHCPSGAKFSGVVCVLLNELNRMTQDGGVLNVLQSVKTMKARNHDFISTYEEYLFVFEVIRCYLDGGDVYANA